MIRIKVYLLMLLLLSGATSYAQVISEGALPTHQDIIGRLKSSFKLDEFDQPNISVIFNKDTILVTGYLANPALTDIKNTVYRTLNGGKSWERHSFNGDAWIYDACHKPDGQVWMGGSDEHIYYSSNYGLAWSKRPKPFDTAGRVLSIYMIDHRQGVAGSLHNGLAVTSNNWATSKQLPTPLDQGTYTILPNSARDRVDKVEVLRSVIIINQDDHVFFSDIDSINWKSFAIPVTDFHADAERAEWHIRSLGSKVFVLSTDLNLKRSYVDSTLLKLSTNTENKEFSLNNFLSAGIKAVMVKGTAYEAEGEHGVHTQYRERSQVAQFKKADSTFFFSSKGYARKYAKLYQFSEKELIQLLSSSSSKSNLSPIDANVYFSEIDFKDYERLLASKREERAKDRVWGGDFSYLLNLDHKLFEEYREVVKSIAPEFLERVYRNYDYGFKFLQGNEPALSMVVINNEGDTLTLHSGNSKYFGLPWVLQSDRETVDLYDADITNFMRENLPNSFINYEKLLGGGLIYELIRERIIDGLKYKNNL